MGVPHVTSFCCCMGLEMGTKVIGCIHLVFALTVMVVCALFAASTDDYRGTVEDAEDQLYSSWYTIAVCVAVVSVVHVMLAAELIVAVIKRSARGVRAWVLLMCVLYALSLLYVLVTVAMYGLSATGSDMFLAFLQAVLFYAILAYFILTANSYYLLLKSVEDMEGPGKQDY